MPKGLDGIPVTALGVRGRITDADRRVEGHPRPERRAGTRVKLPQMGQLSAAQGHSDNRIVALRLTRDRAGRIADAGSNRSIRGCVSLCDIT